MEQNIKKKQICKYIMLENYALFFSHVLTLIHFPIALQTKIKSWIVKKKI